MWTLQNYTFVFLLYGKMKEWERNKASPVYCLSSLLDPHPLRLPASKAEGKVIKNIHICTYIWQQTKINLPYFVGTTKRIELGYSFSKFPLNNKERVKTWDKFECWPSPGCPFGYLFMGRLRFSTLQRLLGLRVWALLLQTCKNCEQRRWCGHLCSICASFWASHHVPVKSWLLLFHTE